MPMRISGMNSGLDIDSMIRDIMKAERMPVNKLLQKKQTLQWKAEAYASINLKFASLRETVSTLRFSGSWDLKLDANGKVDKQGEDDIIAKVKNFVEKYNDTVTTINGKVTEKIYRGFAPLTSEEKSAMNEVDAKNWEEKAKSGLLKSDDILRRALTELRSIPSAKIAGADPAFDTLAELGITTPTFSQGSTENGKLILDEAKLRKAIQENPTAVVNALAQQGTGTGEKGIFQRAYETIDQAMLSISRKLSGGLKAAESLYSQMDKIDKRVEDKNALLNKREDYYYKMFASMEKAMASGNAQLSWLMQQFG